MSAATLFSHDGTTYRLWVAQGDGPKTGLITIGGAVVKFQAQTATGWTQAEALLEKPIMPALASRAGGETVEVP